MSDWTQADVDRIRQRQSALVPRPAKSKYRAQPTVSHGIRFDSKKEARRYDELLLLLHAGAIRDLKLQPIFQLFAYVPTGNQGFAYVGSFVADFQYVEGEKTVVEDVKSSATATPLYRLKRKIAEACHGITIVEV